MAKQVTGAGAFAGSRSGNVGETADPGYYFGLPIFFGLGAAFDQTLGCAGH